MNVILDYRDLWNTPYLSHRISSFMECHALKYADKVVFLNKRMLHDTSSKYNLPKEKCAIILNGYSKKDWDEACGEAAGHESCNCPPQDTMIMRYIGAYHSRTEDLETSLHFCKLLKISSKIKKLS